MVPKVTRTSYLLPALSFYQKWHLSIRSLSSLIEVILEIYRTLKLEWGGMSGDLGGVRVRRGYLDERGSVYDYPFQARIQGTQDVICHVSELSD